MSIHLPTNGLIRTFFFLLFALIIKPVATILLLICIFQMLYQIVAHKKSDSLTILSQHSLSYLVQIIEYLAYLSDRAPFPFTQWKNHYE